LTLGVGALKCETVVNFGVGGFKVGSCRQLWVLCASRCKIEITLGISGLWDLFLASLEENYMVCCDLL